jgi:deferrochelatase/peroxidase EfeB
LTAAGTIGVGAAGIGTGLAIERSHDVAATDAAFIPFEGTRQSGVVMPRPEHGLIAAFDVTAPDRASLVELLLALSATARELMAGTVPEVDDALVPPPDNLILGTQIEGDALTVTIGVGASLFDNRYGLSAIKPAHLTRMPEFPNDELLPEWCHGDLVVQLCARHHDTCAHALRRLVRIANRSVSLRWMMPGFMRPTAGTTSRNLLGFKDGTANLDQADAESMRSFVWVQPDDGEPAWATDGTYMAVRVIRNRVEFWDRTALSTQELVIGRSKASGAPLDGDDEHDEPRYTDDPEGNVTPLSAHIRLANPRTAETNRNRILRRSFNYNRGSTPSALDQGLLFVCFQNNLSEGFVAVQRRLDGEALEQYVTPFGGGFYFVLPGVTRADGWLGEQLLA